MSSGFGPTFNGETMRDIPEIERTIAVTESVKHAAEALSLTSTSGAKIARTTAQLNEKRGEAITNLSKADPARKATLEAGEKMMAANGLADTVDVDTRLKFLTEQERSQNFRLIKNELVTDGAQALKDGTNAPIEMGNLTKLRDDNKALIESYRKMEADVAGAKGYKDSLAKLKVLNDFVEANKETLLKGLAAEQILKAVEGKAFTEFEAIGTSLVSAAAADSAKVQADQYRISARTYALLKSKATDVAAAPAAGTGGQSAPQPGGQGGSRPQAAKPQGGGGTPPASANTTPKVAAIGLSFKPAGMSAGLVVSGVASGSEAEKAGIKAGDMLAAINVNGKEVQFGKPVEEFEQKIALIRSDMKAKGEKTRSVDISIIRNGLITVHLTVTA